MSNILIGLIINLFKTFNYRYKENKELSKLDFLALSSELWELPIIGDDYKLYRKNNPTIKEYA